MDESIARSWRIDAIPVPSACGNPGEPYISECMFEKEDEDLTKEDEEEIEQARRSTKMKKKSQKETTGR